MKLYAPEYYKDFTCIADRCRHSCCIGWEIDVDGETAKTYASLTEGYGRDVRDSVDWQDTPHFRLTKDERCPHLNRSGLCNIIIELGEDCLCDICREHPRFYNDTSRGREVGLGIACEEACRLVLSSDRYAHLITVGELEGDASAPELDALPLREHIYGILSDRALPYHERLRRIYGDWGVSPAMLEDGDWREIFGSLEYLDDSHRALFSEYTSELSEDAGREDCLERTLAYFILRHCTEVCDESEFRSALGACLVFERLLASLSRKRPKELPELARIISEELEYSEDNTQAIMHEFSFLI